MSGGEDLIDPFTTSTNPGLFTWVAQSAENDRRGKLRAIGIRLIPI